MNYKEMKEAHQKKYNALPVAYAFSNTQLTEALEKLGAKDTSEVVSIGAGALVLKKDAHLLAETLNANTQEMELALEDPKFLYEALVCELCNHEYCITYELEDTLGALGLDMDFFSTAERLEALNKACEVAGRCE